jgi:hypothetical protein
MSSQITADVPAQPRQCKVNDGIVGQPVSVFHTPSGHDGATNSVPY